MTTASQAIKPTQPLPDDVQKGRLYKVTGLMGASAVLISAAVILFFDQMSEWTESAGLTHGVQLFTQTLMPYMISAAIAALTAIAILTILPAMRVHEPTQALVWRLRSLRQGDLSSPLAIKGNNYLTVIVAELNESVSSLSNEIIRLKVVNRQQWKLLEEARTALEGGRHDAALLSIERLERNWEKIAEIENRLMTG